jgi:hypothetical protein
MVWVTVALAALIMSVLAAVSLLLPVYVESRLIPRLADSMGLDAREMHVRHIGFRGTDIGHVRFDGKGAPVLSCGAVHIDYSPVSLVRGKIIGVTLIGPRVELAATGDGITIPGLTLPNADGKSQIQETSVDLQTLIPIGIDWLRVQQAEVAIQWGDRRLVVALDAAIDTANLDKGRLSGQVQASILGNIVVLDATIDQQGNHARILLKSNGFLLESLGPTGLIPKRVTLAGTADLHGEVSFSIAPLAVNTVTVDIGLPDVWMAAGDAIIENLAVTGPAAPPVVLKLQSNARHQVQWSCTPFQFTAAARGKVTGLQGVWQPSPSGWTARADIAALLPVQTMASGTGIKNALPLNGRIEARGVSGDSIAFTANAGVGAALTLSRGAAEITTAACNMGIEGRYNSGILAGDGVFSAADVHVRSPDFTAALQRIAANATVALPPPDAESAAAFTIRSVVSDMRSKTGTARLVFPKFEINASGRQADGDAPWRVSAELRTERAALMDPGKKLIVKDISLDLPLEWPPPDNGKNGRLHVRSVQWDKHHLGAIRGILQQGADGVTIDLRHDSKLFPGMVVLAHGGLNRSGPQFEARIADYEVKEGVDLGRFFPEAEGILAKGRISASMQFAAEGNAPMATATLVVDQAGVRQEDSQLELKDVRLDMFMEDLISIRSAPKQTLHIAELQFGKLAAHSLDVEFQVERGQTLFVEKAGIDWCDGRINTAAIRVSPGVEDYDITLFCDRINLAMLLDQLGAAEASGKGTVNGRIPVHWIDGRLIFDNGFLYSTPGQSGAIQLSGTEVLLAGLPPGTPQHTQLDIATEALKDYTYQWAKLFVSSDEDNLLLALKFDGKPNRLLPFAYDKSLGQFKRVAGQGQADFKGISIDLNFTSPLNDIIHYKELLKQN